MEKNLESGYNILMNKQDCRKNAKEIRKNIDLAQISMNIVFNIEKFAEFQKSQNVLLFYPTNREINLISICEKYNEDKNFYLPKVQAENLLICPFNCETDILKKSEFNILEPCSVPVSPEILDFAIIPCLCADKSGYRIGYGGGFYDRFIPKLKNECAKAVTLPECLLYDKLPIENFDMQVDFVITEKRVLKCKN